MTHADELRESQNVLAQMIERRHGLTAGLIEEARQINIRHQLSWATREKLREVQALAERTDEALFFLAERIRTPDEPDFDFAMRVWELDDPEGD